MNIVVLHYHRIGGSGVVAYEIGRAMAEDRGHTVHFMGLEPPFRLGDSLTDRMKFHRVWVKEYAVFDHQPYALALASQLADLIKDEHIDVIHSHYALPHAVSAALAREMCGRPVKTVCTLHGTDITVVGSHASLKNITRWAIDRTDVVTCVSDYLKHETVQHFHTAPERLHTVYNFVNPHFFHPRLKLVSGTPHKTGCKTVVHVSNLREVKDPLSVIRIFHGMLQKIACLELFIVGEGPLLPDMVSLVKELGIGHCVRFLGIRQNIGPILASCDLMLLPSRQESFGLAALESMACGVPALASRAGGLPELIEDGVNGLLFDPDQPQEAVEKGVRILEDDDARKRMGQAAYESAFSHFDIEKVMDQYEALYRK